MLAAVAAVHIAMSQLPQLTAVSAAAVWVGVLVEFLVQEQ
jgi:hypothetical protein